MEHKYLEKQLRDGERIFAVVRRSPIAHLTGWTIGLVCIIAGFFFLYPLLHRGAFGLASLLVILGVGVVFIVRTAVLNRMNVLLLTSERVIDIDQQGLFSRVVSECLYENIQEMSFEVRGLLGTIFHVGTLLIHTSGDRADIRASGIKDPQRVQEMIAKVQKKVASTDSEDLSAQELVQLLEKIRSHVEISAPPPEVKEGEVKRKGSKRS